MKANLDGAAELEGRSADDLLDQIFCRSMRAGLTPASPTSSPSTTADLEWVRELREPPRADALNPEQITATLSRARPMLSDPHVRLVQLNLRSLLVGSGDGWISTSFLESLFSLLIGGRCEAREVWHPVPSPAPLRTAAQHGARPVGSAPATSR